MYLDFKEKDDPIQSFQMTFVWRGLGPSSAFFLTSLYYIVL